MPYRPKNWPRLLGVQLDTTSHGEKLISAAGGFTASLHLGEDVDFCWRMRRQGYSLLYVPRGTVAHKHRNRLNRMLLRRGAYGTSEAKLYHDHRDKKKR